MRHLTLLQLMIVAICACASACRSAADSNVESRETETIVYTTLRPVNWDVFLFDDATNAPRRLTDHPALDYNATFSPDGAWVVFTSERNGNADLFLLELRTNALRQLTHDRAMDDAASFSPDGKSLIFVSTRSGSPEIFKMDLSRDGGDEQAVNLSNSPGSDLNPVFSPDGTRIAFSSNRETKSPLGNEAGLYIINADGTHARRIATGKRTDGSPAWSPDGKRLYFNSIGFSFNPKPVRIYSIAVDGTDLQEHTESTAYAFDCTVRMDGAVAWTQGVDAEHEFSGASFSIKSASAGDWSKTTTVCEGYLRPRFDPSGKRMLCHGPGPVDKLTQMPNGNPFGRAGADKVVTLPDRKVRVLGVRAYFPSLSADGSAITAMPWLHPKHGRPAGPSAIYRTQLDGNSASAVFSPTDEDVLWATLLSRDSRWLFFCKGPPMAKGTTDVDIWRVRSDGSEARNLTPDSSANDAFPDVSADGKRIVFRSGRESSFQIFVCDQDGNNVRRITDGKGRHTMPAISPDGSIVVYTSQFDGGFRLFVQSLEKAGGVSRLLEPGIADLARADMHPRFSPDGKWIVFTSSRGGFNDDWHNCGFYPQPYGDLWAVPVDGSCPAIRLTNDKWEDGLAYWGL